MGDPLGQEADALVNPEVAVEVPPPEQMSLIKRLRQPRTILSIAVPLIVIVVAVALNWDDMKDVPAEIGRANPLLVLLAFAVGTPSVSPYRWMPGKAQGGATANETLYALD